MNRLRIFLIVAVVFVANTSFFIANNSKSAYYIVIDKSDYELNVYDAQGWLVAFSCSVWQQ